MCAYSQLRDDPVDKPTQQDPLCPPVQYRYCKGHSPQLEKELGLGRAQGIDFMS